MMSMRKAESRGFGCAFLAFAVSLPVRAGAPPPPIIEFGASITQKNLNFPRYPAAEVRRGC